MPAMAPISRRNTLWGRAVMGNTARAQALPAPDDTGSEAFSPDPLRTPSLAGIASDTTARDVIMLIRHAEKPTGTLPPVGITADGTPSAGSLTVTGWTRAGALVALFAPPYGDPPPGLWRPTTIWAADPREGAGQRPWQTVRPLAARLGITVETRFGKAQASDLAAALRDAHGIALVAWQHEEIPTIVAHLGNVTPLPPTQWPEERFDLVWVFTRTDTGWAFSQVPQLLLVGDRNEVIRGS